MNGRFCAIDVAVTRNQRRIIDGLDLRLCPGEIVSIEGKSGVGKSTLLLTLAGLLQRSRGEISISGINIDEMNPRERARHCAIAMQSPVLPPDLKVGDLVRLGRGPQLQAVPNWRRRFGSVFDPEPDAVAHALEEVGLNTFEQRPLGSLSGGEQRRAHIARVLAQRSSLLLLDEPTTHLDEESSRRILSALCRRAKSGVAVLLATHDVGITGPYCKRRLRLSDGTLVSATQGPKTR